MAPGMKHIWTTAEINFLKENWEKMTNKELAKSLGLTITLTRTKLYELGLKRMILEYWTEEQIKFLKENYKVMGDVEIAEIFDLKYHKNKGWTKKHIEKKRGYLKLKRSKKEIKDIHRRNVDAGRFQICVEKMWAVRGITDVGTIRIWKTKDGLKYKVIKTSEGFVHYSRWLYEKLNGPIPEGLVVKAKNNITLDVRPENLELIDRAENARRNRISNLPIELQTTIKLRNKLKSQINNH